MNHYRRVYEDMPDVVVVPPELRRRRVEVILLPLDETAESAGKTESQGWSKDFFERTAGRWSGAPIVRESPGNYDAREEMD